MTETGERAQIVDVQVWSDIACPWCFIGKRRLERALVAPAAFTQLIAAARGRVPVTG